MRLLLFTLLLSILSFSLCRSYSASEQALMIWNKLVGRSSNQPRQSSSSNPIKLKYKGIERLPCSAKAIRNKSCPGQQQQEQKAMNSSAKIYSQSFLLILLLILIPFFYIIN